MKKVLLLVGIAVVSTIGWMSFGKSDAQAQQPAPPETIKWYSVEEAEALMDKAPRKMFIDFYTGWCGWCKVMDANTFANPVIAKYMNEHYYCVKFNAESYDTVKFAGQTFVNRGNNQPRFPHDFAGTIMQGKMSYPTYSFISKGPQGIGIILMPGYYPPEQFEPYLHYYGENKETVMTFEEFKKTFKSQLPPAQPAPAPTGK